MARLPRPDGESKWITGEEARRHVHQTRGQVDAIMVGIGTVLKDDPQLVSAVHISFIEKGDHVSTSSCHFG